MNQTPPLHIESEPVDDVPVILGWLKQMQVGPLIDAVLPAPHGNRDGLSYGALAECYLAFIVSEGDHRLSYVEPWVAQRRRVLSWQLQRAVGDKDFTDDRLEDLLRALGNPETGAGEALDLQLGQHLIGAYALPTPAGRIDSTSVSVYHQRDAEGEEETLLKYGHSKDHRPDLRQFMQQLGTLDPAGVPLITTLLPGNSAEDPHYLPAWRRMVGIIGHARWLLVGDSKFSSLANQAQVQQGGGRYLAPMPMKGDIPEQFRAWVLEPPVAPRWLKVAGLPTRQCQGFEVSVEREWTPPTEPDVTPPAVRWTQRMLLIWRKPFADAQRRQLHERLARAEEELRALSCKPPEEDAALAVALEAILAQHEVQDLLSATPHWSTTQRQVYVGPGRPGPQRQTRTVTERHLRLDLRRRPSAIEQAEALLGWRLYATNAPATELSLAQAVQYYSGQWQAERGMHRLKDRPLGVAPVFLRDETCLRGLLVLLSLALRLLTLPEFVVRRTLQERDETVAGLYEGNPTRRTERPTTERLFRAFKGIVLHCYRVGRQWHYQLSVLSELHKRLLDLMGLSRALYRAPAFIPSG